MGVSGVHFGVLIYLISIQSPVFIFPMTLYAFLTALLLTTVFKIKTNGEKMITKLKELEKEEN